MNAYDRGYMAGSGDGFTGAEYGASVDPGEQDGYYRIGYQHGFKAGTDHREGRAA